MCIYRLPRDLSVVRPRSHCPACEKQIAWYDNIPVLSYLLLGGRCRHCQRADSAALSDRRTGDRRGVRTVRGDAGIDLARGKIRGVERDPDHADRDATWKNAFCRTNSRWAERCWESRCRAWSRSTRGSRAFCCIGLIGPRWLSVVGIAHGSVPCFRTDLGVRIAVWQASQARCPGAGRRQNDRHAGGVSRAGRGLADPVRGGLCGFPGRRDLHCGRQERLVHVRTAVREFHRRRGPGDRAVGPRA